MHKSVVFITALLLISVPALAQVNTGDLAGKVALDDGSPLPGVLVTLTGETAGKLTTTSTAGGNYRFLKLSPGLYELSFQRDGFKTAVKRDIRVSVGAVAALDIVMEVGVISQEIEVVARPRMIETRRAAVTANITSDLMEKLPVANNVMAIVNLAPGVVDGGVTVGGQGSGTSNIAGIGSVPEQNEWTVDGTQANNSDYFVVRMGPAINIQYLEEAQITVAAGDITARKGGVQVNFVSKRAGNRVSGEATIFLMDEMLEMDQTLPPAMAAKGWVKQGIVRHWDFGASIGFPVIKDHLWFFGSAVNADRINRYYAGTTDRPTANPNYFGKINAQYKNTRAEFVANWNNYEILGIIYSPYANTKRNLYTPTAYYTAQLNQVIGKLMISAKYSLMKNKERYHAGNIPFDDPYSLKTGNTYYKPGWATSWNGAYPQRYYATPNGANSSSYREQKRPFVMVDGTYFAENFLGADHEIKLGVEWEKPYYFLIGGSPNQMWVYVNYPDAIAPGGKATFFQTQRNNYRDLWTSRTGFFFQDVVTFKKFTASFGLRYDTHTLSWGEAGCPKWSSVNPDGSPFAFTPWEKYLVAYSTPAGEASQKIGGWSPRFNLSYDLTGDGKNVVKLALAHYGGVVGNREINLAALYPGANMPYLRSPFDDKNGNYWPDPGEFTFYTPAEMQVIQTEKKLVSYNWYQYFFMNNDGPIPAAESAAIVDPDFKAPAIDEILLSYERQLTTDMVLRANAIYRKNYNALRYPVIHYWGTKSSPVVESADSYEVIATDAATGRRAYRLKPSLGNYIGNYLTNFKKSSSDYKGVRFEFNKFMSHRWMLNASVDLSLARFRADEWDCFGTFHDNMDYFDGGPFLPLATLWALTGGPANSAIASSDWQFKINGLYQLPWGITVSGVFSGRQGWPVPEYGAVYSGTYLAKKDAKFGDVRLKDLFILDLAVEKAFTIGATTRVLLIANVYNALNNSSIIQVNNTEIPQKLTPLAIVRPGIAQLGFRVKW